MLISEALLALHEVAQTAAPTLPHLSGQRLTGLRKAVETRANQCGHLKHVLTVLDSFQTFESRRIFICHGVAILLHDLDAAVDRLPTALGHVHKLRSAQRGPSRPKKSTDCGVTQP